MNRGDHAASRFGISERDQHLIDHHIVEDGVTRRAQPCREACRMAAGALDQVGQSLPPQRAQRRPYLDTPCPPGEIRCVVLGLAGLADHEVGRIHRHGSVQLPRIAHEDDAAVVRHVEPLVCVRRPRIGVGETVDELRAGRSSRRPEPERAVHVHPGARRMGARDDLRGGVERAGIDVAGL